MTDAYLLDTNIICALADATRTTHESAVRRLERARDFVLLPSPAVGEIEFGMAKALNLKPVALRRALRATLCLRAS